MASDARAKRVATRIHHELAALLQKEVADPRLASVTITGVDVDRELSYATVHVTQIADQLEQREVLSVLEGAKGFLRHQLAALIPLRSFPMLRFKWDSTYTRGSRIEELLNELRSEEGADGGDS